MQQFLQKYFKLLLCIGILLNALGLFTPVLTGDSMLYADVAKYMVQKKDWFNLYAFGKDWLDKPHFPFWFMALSFKIFGINAFAYKLSSFLFWLLGIYYLHNLAKIFYNKHVAQLSCLVYVIALHTVISNFDVRAEAYLTTLILGALYYSFLLYKNSNWKDLLLAAAFCAATVMTKGIFFLLIIGGGFIIYWILQKDWRQFAELKWYLLIALTFIGIFPEIYSLYLQFDLHPEKIVFDQKNVSGLKFFFWDSQFGRFFNTGPITGNGDKTFFLHTTLWAFLPWTVIFLCSLFDGIKNIKTLREKWILYGGSILAFIFFSLSGFQLPHYIIILFPYFSIGAASYLSRKLNNEKILKILKVCQFTICCIAVVVVLLILWITGWKYKILIGGLYLLLSIVMLLFILKKNTFIRIIFYAYAFAVIVYSFMNIFFYPFIMQYQAGMKAAKYVNDKQNISSVGMMNYSTQLRFYSNKEIVLLKDCNETVNFLKQSHTAAFVSKDSLKLFTQNKKQIIIIKELRDFHVTKLSLKFLDKKQREATLKEYYLIKFKKE